MTIFFAKIKPWSETKNKILGFYLRPYFQKILLTRKPIYYFDCFAGKGKFDDGADGSPLIAIKALKDSLAESTATAPPKVHLFFQRTSFFRRS
jgi:three-Cys-motif partner protein